MRTIFLSLFLCLFLGRLHAAELSKTTPFEDVSSYITSHWGTLTRDITKCYTFGDLKIQGQKYLYFPANFTIPPAIKALQSKCHVQISQLPKPITKMANIKLDLNDLSGLLYLPNPYVVPGGMFNEMYGWDSYFIIRGLVEDGQIDLAKGMVENFFFELDYYGAILNANRAYYLSRSQPPFLTAMILSVYNAMKVSGQADVVWLRNAYQHAVKDYNFWIRSPHLAGKTGLSRYFDFNHGPVAELKESITSYYQDAAKYFLLHPEEAKDYLDREGKPGRMGPVFFVKICPITQKGSPEICDNMQNIGLTQTFYTGDRAVRESGLDITFRFGPFGAGTVDYAPVDLNSLLYKTELDLETISYELGKKQDADVWHRRALERKEKMNKLFWNQEKSLYFDFNVVTNNQSSYEYITAFYPLWVGLASPEQARAVRDKLVLFEKKGGLVTSTYKSGAQWDYPYGWAPFQLIVVEGLRKYGFNEDADRISIAFLTMVANHFHRDGTIREKYDVETASAETQIQVGYQTNEVGFGWTNGVFLSLLHGLSREALAELAKKQEEVPPIASP